jgi:hypothetical protein
LGQGFANTSEQEIGAYDESVWTKEQVRTRDWLLEATLIFECELDVGPHQQLDGRAETIACGVSRESRLEIGGRIDDVVPR